MDVLDGPAVCEEEPHHVHTGQDHEEHAQDVSYDHAPFKDSYLKPIRFSHATVCQRIFLSDFCGVIRGSNIYDDLDVDQHVDDPEKKERRKNFQISFPIPKLLS
ncbi:Swi/Snf Complex Subunit Smarcc1 [Manis pentadactyla]|nr:Swi/Snf Complex Subunit Smarcc1 [Manis pentadactyla]